MTPYITNEDVMTAARTIYGEARGEPYEGKLAVAWVILNRWRSGRKRWDSISKVCLDHMQFSCWNPGDPNLWKLAIAGLHNPTLRECLKAVIEALDGEDITHKATHYHTKAVMPSWAEGHRPCAVIGNHVLYNTVK